MVAMPGSPESIFRECSENKSEKYHALSPHMILSSVSALHSSRTSVGNCRTTSLVQTRPQRLQIHTKSVLGLFLPVYLP